MNEGEVTIERSEETSKMAGLIPEVAIKKKKKKEKDARGRETLFRSTYMNQVNLIHLADQKANMIISINTMIISAIIAISGYGTVADTIQYNRGTILIPLVLIVLSSLISVVFAIQAARPKVVKAKQNIKVKEKSSLLFFGEIVKYTQQEYLSKMDALINTKAEVYEHMTIDLYNQGKILSRKYTMLAYAYQIFMFGFVISVVLFLFFLVMK